MQSQTSALCLHCCQKSFHVSCCDRTIHWTLYSSASKPRWRQRMERGKAFNTIKLPSVFFFSPCIFFLSFFVSWKILIVFFYLSWYLSIISKSERNVHAFGEKKRITWRLCKKKRLCSNLVFWFANERVDRGYQIPWMPYWFKIH